MTDIAKKQLNNELDGILSGFELPKTESMPEVIEYLQSYTKKYILPKLKGVMPFSEENLLDIIDHVIIRIFVEKKYNYSMATQRKQNLSRGNNNNDTNAKTHTTYSKMKKFYKTVFKDKKYQAFFRLDIEKEVSKHLQRKKCQIANDYLGLYFFFMLNKVYCYAYDKGDDAVNRFCKSIEKYILSKKRLDVKKILDIASDVYEEDIDEEDDLYKSYMHACAHEFVRIIINTCESDNECGQEELYGAAFATMEVLSHTIIPEYKIHLAHGIMEKVNKVLIPCISGYKEKKTKDLKKSVKNAKRITSLTKEEYILCSKYEAALIIISFELHRQNIDYDMPFKEYAKNVILMDDYSSCNEAKRVRSKYSRPRRRINKAIKVIDKNITVGDMLTAMRLCAMVSSKHIKECFIDFCESVNSLSKAYRSGDIGTVEKLCASIYVQAYCLCIYIKIRGDDECLDTKNLIKAIVNILISTITDEDGYKISLYCLLTWGLERGISNILDNTYKDIDEINIGAARVMMLDIISSHTLECMLNISPTKYVLDTFPCMDQKIDILNLIDKDVLKELCRFINIYTDFIHKTIDDYISEQHELESMPKLLFQYIKEQNLLSKFNEAH